MTTCINNANKISGDVALCRMMMEQSDNGGQDFDADVRGTTLASLE